MHLLIAAAGSGRRMGSKRNKLLLPLVGKPVLAWTLDSVVKAKSINWIGVIGQPLDKDIIVPLLNQCSKEVKWIDGGNTRQESVQKGLASLPPDAKHVLIHDGARCLVDSAFIDVCSKTLSLGKSLVAATPVTDTIKRVDDQGVIIDTPKRSELWAAQTPQGFLVSDLKNAHKIAIDEGWEVTDDASLYEQLGWPVNIIESSPSNIKVTTPFDMQVAEALIAS